VLTWLSDWFLWIINSVPALWTVEDSPRFFVARGMLIPLAMVLFAIVMWPTIVRRWKGQGKPRPDSTN
jgi:hypothetical protein